MNGCQEFQDLLDLFLDGELSSEDMLRVQEHLDACPNCRNYVDDVLTIRAAFPSVEDTEVPEGFAESVMERVRDGTPKPVRVDFRRRRWVSAAAALAACFAIAVVLKTGPVGLKGGMEDSVAVKAAEDTVNEEISGNAVEESVSEAQDTAGAEESPADQETKQTTTSEPPAEIPESQSVRNTSEPAAKSRTAPPVEDTGETRGDIASVPSAVSMEPDEEENAPADEDNPLNSIAPPYENDITPPESPSMPAPLMLAPASGDMEAAGPDLILTEEEAGSLLDSFTPAEDNDTERTYLLTQEEFAGLMEELNLEYVQTEQKDLMTVLVTVA